MTRKRKSGPRSTRSATCEHCGEGFASYLSNGNWTRYCTRRCGASARQAAAGTHPLLRRVSVATHHGHCDGCGRHYQKATALQRYCTEECRPSGYAWQPVQRKCGACGSEFVAGKWQRTCSPGCEAEVQRKHRRIDKSRRRARLRAVEVEAIDPLLVFARDGWRCQLCGVETPSGLRGTYEETAPELDHIVALAAGGAHTWRNVQCACRRCNGIKGARSIDQMQVPRAA